MAGQRKINIPISLIWSVVPASEVFTVSGLFAGCVLLHLRAAALFGPVAADLAD